MDQILTLLKDLGIPGWIITIGGALWILSQLKILDPVILGIRSFFETEQKRQERREAHKLKLESEKVKGETLEELRSQYSASWLMEQVTQNSSDALSQLGSYQEYVQGELSKKLDIVVELGVKFTSLSKDIEEIRIRLGEIYTQLDVIDRHLYELKDE